MIRVPAHAALAFVGVPLGAIAATVQLVVRPLFWIWEAVPVNAQTQRVRLKIQDSELNEKRRMRHRTNFKEEPGM